MESKTIMNWILCGSLAMLVLVSLAGPLVWTFVTNGGGHMTMVNFVQYKGAETMSYSKLGCDSTKSAMSTMAAFGFILFFLIIALTVIQVLITFEKLRFGVVAIIGCGVCALVSLIEFSMIAAFYGSTQCGGKVSENAKYGSALGLYIMLTFVFGFFGAANFFVNGIKSE